MVLFGRLGEDDAVRFLAIPARISVKHTFCLLANVTSDILILLTFLKVEQPSISQCCEG